MSSAGWQTRPERVVLECDQGATKRAITPSPVNCRPCRHSGPPPSRRGHQFGPAPPGSRSAPRASARCIRVHQIGEQHPSPADSSGSRIAATGDPQPSRNAVSRSAVPHGSDTCQPPSPTGPANPAFEVPVPGQDKARSPAWEKFASPGIARDVGAEQESKSWRRRASAVRSANAEMVIAGWESDRRGHHGSVGHEQPG